MTSCPHCGSNQGYSVKVRAFGHVVHEGTWDGHHEHIANDSELRMVADKRVRCLECRRMVLAKRLRGA